jgi:hypothetical protein
MPRHKRLKKIRRGRGPAFEVYRLHKRVKPTRFRYKPGTVMPKKKRKVTFYARKGKRRVKVSFYGGD